MTNENTDQKVLFVTLAAPNPDNQEALGLYGQESGKLASQARAKVIARFPITEQLYGECLAGILGIAEMPSAEAVKAMFSSPAYQTLIPIREKALAAVSVYISPPGQSTDIQINPDKALMITVAVPNPDEKEALGQYQQGAGPLVGKYGGKPVANIPVAEAIYADCPAAFLGIAEFPDAAAVKGFLNDEAYQALIPLRDKALRSLNLYLA